MLISSLHTFTSFATNDPAMHFAFLLDGVLKYQMIWILFFDTRFREVFHTIYLGSRKLFHIALSLVAYFLSNVLSLEILYCTLTQKPS